MSKIEEPLDLLLETEIISSEEKAEILERINEGFISRQEDMYGLGQLSAKSSGLILPLSVSVIAIICTILILLFSGPLIKRSNEDLFTNKILDISGSEWGVLKVYMEQSTIKLENKNSEIIRYKEEIVNYDLKINTLRDLLRIKTETEKKLEEERSKLSIEGIAEEDIVVKINVLEENLKSELTPAMITYYNLSIDDINHQIDRVLEDKTESEKKLKVSMDEYEILVTEKKQLEEDIQQKSDKISQVSEAMEAMKIITEVAIQYENENAVRAEIGELYFEIFASINEKEYNYALEKIISLQITIEESVQDDNINFNQLPLYISFIKVLDDYVKKLKVSTEGDDIKTSEIENIIENISNLTDKVLKNSKENEYKLAERELRSLIASVPGLESAFSILSSITEQNMALNDSFVEEVKNTEEKDSPETIVEEINSSEELILLGIISQIKFDQISIKLLVEFDIKTGMKFYIFKKDDYNTERVLGSGTIIDVLDNTVSGKLESLFISTSKPAGDDLIYIKLDIDL